MIEEVVNETEKILADEKRIGEEDAAEGNKDSPANENEEKEPEDKVDGQFIIAFPIYFEPLAKTFRFSTVHDHETNRRGLVNYD